MSNSWNKSKNIYSGIIKSSISALIFLLIITGCRQNATIFNTGPLTPLINSRYSSNNSVKTLIKLNKDNRIDYQKYIEGRHSYNRAASRINGLITQIIISIQANSKITDNQLFKDQIIAAFKDSNEFQKYVEAVSKPSNTRGGSVELFKAIPFNPIDVNKLVEQISEATKAARKANSQQKAIIVCELKSLLLPDFDEVEAGSNLKKYPNDECAKLIKNKDFTPDNNSNTPSLPKPPIVTPPNKPPVITP
ncbi:MAG: hypothetical protein AAF915_20120 [Cyanobacteria bacterium P01_D01_bin.50]